MSDSNQKKSLKIEILEKIAQLVTAGFGLVAALAWNDAIKTLFIKIFPKPDDNLIAMFIYALVITVLIVLITIQISRLIEVAKIQLKKDIKTEIKKEEAEKNNK
ncbi:MAG: DUF5654 family protein [Patescibacteria group bacterium]